ncbi:cell division protein FtsQ/DivIB [Deminuibacter soli]|uniref:Cell division protein FtsQ n=1 Tax=Deminuibacter soli TaxID=2291815 RepID=A0A3E1NEH6_9BACT|nr:cell division protein FtsQ/DivIB [Deminuibacter soli]RFM26201.1 hypothetical protein DXN05_21640 [Deminuibacter soli]
MWKKRIQFIAWCTLGAGILVLLVMAMRKKDEAQCTDIKIEIEGAQDHVFVDEKDVLDVLKRNGAAVKAPLAGIPLRRLETILEKDAWIKEANLFFDNNHVLQVKIEEREPLARVFTKQGNSFYIDSSGKRLPLSDKLSARVPVFTSFPSERVHLSGPDSAVLQDVRHIADFIARDSFWVEQVSQIDITSQHTYEMTPVLGNQVIMLGDASDLEGKFGRLLSFYKQVWTKTGFEKYEKIDVQYSGQVVAVKKGTAKQVIDSARAMEVLTNGMAQVNSMLGDTSGVRKLAAQATLAKAVKDTAHTAAAAPPKPPAVRPKPGAATAAGNKHPAAAAKPPAGTAVHGGAPKPRAVMPARKNKR